MIKKIILCVVTLLVITAKAQFTVTPPSPSSPHVVPNIDWITYYSDRANIYNSASAIDADNNVYTTGNIFTSTSNSNLIIQKRDSLGTLLWTYLYPYSTGINNGAAITVVNGHVYVAGESLGTSTGQDFVTIHLDPSGSLFFANRYNNSNHDDKAVSIKVDASGNVYTLGTSRNSAGNDDIVTIGYSSNGTLLWQNNFNSIGTNETATGLAIAGSVLFVTGTTINSSGNTDIVTYQLDISNGGNNWTTITGGTAAGNDKSGAIIISGQDALVCGTVYNNTTGNDHTLIRYNGSNGAVIYKADYDFANGDNGATALVRDSTGNVAVTGYALNGTLYEYHTVFYDSTGTSGWVHKMPTYRTGMQVSPKIACDSVAAHFYICGEILNATPDILVYQITPTGSTGWKKSMDGSLQQTDFATNICVNGAGIVYLSALSANSAARYDITTIKIGQTPVYVPADYGTPELKDDRFVFQQNHGQLLHPNGTSVIEHEVGFYNQGTNPSYYFNNTGIGHILIDRDTILDSLVRVDLKILGGNTFADMYSYEPVEAKKHYFTDSNRSITDVNSYARLFIPNIYPNVDLHHYSNTSGLKSYFVFKIPGESIPGMRLLVDGANSTTINSDGNLIASTDLGDINMGLPTAYQATFNPTSMSYVTLPLTANWNHISGNMYNFSVTGAIPFWPVVVYLSKPGATSATPAPPIGNLYWSSFVGDQGQDQIKCSKTDARDNFYIGGSTTSINYPVVGPFQSAAPLASSATYGVINRFDKFGELKYGTYYGGAGSNCGTARTEVNGIAIDSLYNIYMVGFTNSKNMKIQPKSGAISFTTNASTSSNCFNAFIAKLNPSGNAIHFSSYYGGTGDEAFNCVRYKNGQIFIGGSSDSPTITLVNPQPNTFQITSGAGMYMHIDTTGAVKHNTKLQQRIVAADVDNQGNFYMVSNGASGVVPIIAPASSFYTHNYIGNWDWALQRFSPADSLTWSTQIGGTGYDYVNGICIRDSVMVLCGNGSSTNWPFVKTASDSGDVAFGGVGSNDVQLIKFNLKAGNILWSAYHGTKNNELAAAVALDKDYNLFVTGAVDGGYSFKTLAYSGYYQQNVNIGTDGFLLGYNSKNQRRWTTFFGSLTSGNGFNNDSPTSVAINNDNKLFISGATNVKNNSLPLVRWNNVCYYDSVVADLYPSPLNDGFTSMFDVTEFKIVGINEYSKTEKYNGVSLFPNPNNGIFSVKFTEQPQETYNLSVINVMGQTVYQKQNVKPEGDLLNIDLGNLSKGIYLINISDSKRTGTLKFVIH